LLRFLFKDIKKEEHNVIIFLSKVLVLFHIVWAEDKGGQGERENFKIF